MTLIIQLPADNTLPDSYLKLPVDTGTIVLAIHEEYYPGTHDIQHPKIVTNLAEYMISQHPDITSQIFSLGVQGLTINNLTNIGPGAVKVYD